MSIDMNSSRHKLWRSISSACVLWLVGGAVGGMVPAAISGEHGSIIFVVLGVFTGICGAVTHGCLLPTTWFRQQEKLAQVTTLWIGTLFLFLTAASIVNFASRLEALKVVLVYLTAPVLVAAAICNELINRESAS